MHSMGLKKQNLLDSIYCISEKWDSCDELTVRMRLQIPAVTSLLSEILKIYTAARKTRNLVI